MPAYQYIFTMRHLMKLVPPKRERLKDIILGKNDIGM